MLALLGKKAYKVCDSSFDILLIMQVGGLTVPFLQGEGIRCHILQISVTFSLSQNHEENLIASFCFLI